jgi:hypothetical protein
MGTEDAFPLGDLESQVAAYEDDALRALVRVRGTDADPQPGYPGRFEDVFEEAEASVAAERTH